jgi:hypothetical protein
MFPAALEHLDAWAFFRHLGSHNICTVEAGNRHFVIANGALMNFTRTAVIRYLLSTFVACLDPFVEELAPRCLSGVQIHSLIFSEPSRLRFIRCSAFENCTRLASITIPPTVEVIETEAFRYCLSLHGVRIGTGSRLRLIEKKAFYDCMHIDPIDVPSSAKVRGLFCVLATVYDEDGSKRKRVQFMTRRRRRVI